MSNKKYAVIITILAFYWAFMIYAPMANSAEMDCTVEGENINCEFNLDTPPSIFQDWFELPETQQATNNDINNRVGSTPINQ